MQEEAAQQRRTGGVRRCSVETVTGDRVPEARQVDTDLMRASRADADFEKTEGFELFENTIAG